MKSINSFWLLLACCPLLTAPQSLIAQQVTLQEQSSDSPNTAKKAIVDLHRRWLQEAGLCVDQGVQVEINPRFALKVSDLRKKIDTNERIDADRYFDTQLES